MISKHVRKLVQIDLGDIQEAAGEGGKGRTGRTTPPRWRWPRLNPARSTG